jgi:hypothetical protein
MIMYESFLASPYLLRHAQPEPFINGEHVVASSSKLIAIDKLLADILPKGEQVLIFSVRRTASSSRSVFLTVVINSNLLGMTTSSTR